MTEPPPFYDDLAGCLDETWRRLEEGAAHQSGFHTPALATIGRDGAPRLRTVVLRGVDRTLRTLRVHCDARSGKAAEIAADPRAALHAYDPKAKLQVRIEGTARLHGQDAVARAAWAASRPMSRVCYATSPGPGTPLAEGGATIQPRDDEAVEAGFPEFRVIVLTAARLEFLYLARQGHRRALFTWDGEAEAATWLAP
ncbi:pyridoxamine 5'-phosphate oxidase family protein [Methylobacterium platani]|uniref:Pyridoxamine 5'-phosphate oxidase n=2 Tax=Methylobacterium platani TaxID=427683 RepID=A0A179SBU2_9HYPH|nr:pyridoxamine 5'-phosphate oxidase family protein [Methylobacterium platani]KMO12312.1 pyridoxamine 5'-phosphate oxidase [Methylobacterium platani JCM 14648]OAS23809.1 pyridoxamine 5'-phosphate oxidase [Methylobacterium platani]